MTAEEFYKSKGFYSADTEYSKQFFGEILEIAEAYKEHERERYEALVRLTNAEEFEALQKEVEELRECLRISMYMAKGDKITPKFHKRVEQALKE